MGSRLFVRIDKYPQISEKTGDDLDCVIDLLWGRESVLVRCYCALRPGLSGQILTIALSMAKDPVKKTRAAEGTNNYRIRQPHFSVHIRLRLWKKEKLTDCRGDLIYRQDHLSALQNINYLDNQSLVSVVFSGQDHFYTRLLTSPFPSRMISGTSSIMEMMLEGSGNTIPPSITRARWPLNLASIS